MARLTAKYVSFVFIVVSLAIFCLFVCLFVSDQTLDYSDYGEDEMAQRRSTEECEIPVFVLVLFVNCVPRLCVAMGLQENTERAIAFNYYSLFIFRAMFGGSLAWLFFKRNINDRSTQEIIGKFIIFSYEFGEQQICV